VRNPLAEDEAHLRRDLLSSLARRTEYNLARMQGNVRPFEIGDAFAPGATSLPEEQVRVAALIMGERRPPHFTEPRPPRFDEWDAKALGELAAEASFPDARIELRPETSGDVLWRVEVDGRAVGEVKRVPLDAPVWAAPAFGVELVLSVVDATPVRSSRRVDSEQSAGADAERARRYIPLPITPAAEIDLALLVPDRVAAEQVESLIRQSSGDLLERVTIFDEFRGAGIPAGTRSLGWRLTFRHPDRTLRDKEVEARTQKLLRTLEAELGVRQRT
jgi:phenylalanyl-tRNA synthetase beta chain